MRHLSIIMLIITLNVNARDIPQSVIETIYDEVRTPYKYGLVVAPETDYEKFDCPTVFRENGRWYMTYVRYDGKEGDDGRGYETWIAESGDLLRWTTLGRVLSFTDSGWDRNQHAGYPALVDWTWGGSYGIQEYKGRHWMSYFGGEGRGYEAVEAPLSIGMAWTKDDVTKPHQWHTSKKPSLAYDDKDAGWWESLTQYKSMVYKNGKEFIMFYNAGGKNDSLPKGERIGIATSRDMRHWKRYKGNPVFAHDSDGTITGDAQIVKMDSLYVMFYFSAFNPTRDYNAYNTFAVSRDLIHWQDWDGDDLIVPSKPYDDMFAHKSWVMKVDGVVYHFYCAVNSHGQRGIALATSKRMGKSEVRFPAPEPTGHRYTQRLNERWVRDDGEIFSVPFNLDDYYGALNKIHGNLHGTATFTKRFHLPALNTKEYFIQFEGVGTYATLTLNGKTLGRYDIGRTVETVDVSDAIRQGDNELTVTVDHPEGITDMPWVCGGCSSEWGFSEGSQPFGIFRPVTLIATDRIRVEPFGVHLWSNTACDSLFIETEVKNYGDSTASISLVNKLLMKSGRQVARLTDELTLRPGETKVIRQQSAVSDIRRWTIEKPYLYNVQTLIKRQGKATDDVTTPFGFRDIRWGRQFMLNNHAVFINGVSEYEHEFGQSHAFSDEQIEARVKMARAAGFNAFRDAHQPHNLHYQTLIDEQGLLWWPQFSAHIWYDTPLFRESFKRHLIQWVKERRNSPSLILWGLQNESALPADFARECSAIIRSMDPTCGAQRLITTCNGGAGTDWDVVQNWSGTYGGDVSNYGDELKRPEQLLNGEYGAWRTLGNHSGIGATEETFADIILTKMRQAESAKDSVCGHFLWLLCSHDNPGRRQPDEGLRRIDKVGPFNYKGLLTVWDQPTELYEKLTAAASPTEEGFGVIPPITTEGNGKTTLRLNCGGDAFVDDNGDCWMADDSTFSHSWGDDFGVSSYQCSQTADYSLPVSPMLKTARFGRHRLWYTFYVPQGEYVITLHFIEPWYGRNGGDSEGYRLFDVAVNDSTVIRDLDIWAQAGYARPYARSFHAASKDGRIKISFPKVKAGQAIISGIEITGTSPFTLPPARPAGDYWRRLDLDTLIHTPDSLLPPRTTRHIEVEGEPSKGKMTWRFTVGVAKTYALRFRYHNAEGERRLHVTITDNKGVRYKDDDITFLETQRKAGKRKTTSVTTGGMINAGSYTVTLTGEGLDEMTFDNLTVE